ncbi:hypothetical protein FHW83_003138 [Duganella sp. SG902]|uniref:hypothetical protein n=1 Tax=Duganella sp. SG902 TaxID=2587016 RepID=UPI00159DD373|nr:hypothetical protein [Duganella sp. SG902]NVM77332.1 hypothetical protein [Duganella sp. SG902]
MSIQFASDTDHAASVKAALHSQQQAPFPLTISQLFLRSNPEQRADLLNHLLANVSPEMRTALAGSIGSFSEDGTHPHITPEQTEQIAPGQVEEIAATAEQHTPGVLAQLQPQGEHA